jgi:hypothetical protein
LLDCALSGANFLKCETDREVIEFDGTGDHELQKDNREEGSGDEGENPLLTARNAARICFCPSLAMQESSTYSLRPFAIWLIEWMWTAHELHAARLRVPESSVLVLLRAASDQPARQRPVPAAERPGPLAR